MSDVKILSPFLKQMIFMGVDAGAFCLTLSSYYYLLNELLSVTELKI